MYEFPADRWQPLVFAFPRNEQTYRDEAPRSLDTYVSCSHTIAPEGCSESYGSYISDQPSSEWVHDKFEENGSWP